MTKITISDTFKVYAKNKYTKYREVKTFKGRPLGFTLDGELTVMTDDQLIKDLFNAGIKDLDITIEQNSCSDFTDNIIKDFEVMFK